MLRRGRYSRGSPTDPTQDAAPLQATVETMPELSVDPEVQQQQQQQEQEVETTPNEADSAIAQAWMNKRREQLNIGGFSKTAVDLDAVVPTMSIPQSSDHLSTRRVTFNPSSYDEFDAESSLSSRSIRTDKTPIVSNRMPGAPRRPLLLTSSSPSSYSEAIMMQQPQQHDLSCKDVFDIKKWHGKVLYALIFLLMLSVITVIATATLTGGGGGGSSDDSKSPEITLDTTMTSGGGGGMFSPSQAPSSSVVMEISTDPPSDDDPEFSAPTFATVTLETSPPFPSRAPTTSAPAIALGDPTARPSAAPVGPAPTLSPAPTRTIAPSSQPSFSPSLSLAGLTMNLGETFRFDHEASSVAISKNALVIAIANTEFVTIFDRSGAGNWIERDSIPGSDGAKVAVNGDGSVIAISTPTETAPGGQAFSGMVRVYLRDFQQGYRLLGQELDIGSENSFFGAGLALSFTGRTIAVGAPFFSTSSQRRVGQVRVYEYSSARNRWVPLGAPLFGNDAEDWFGTTLAIMEPDLDQPLIVAVSAPHSITLNGYVQTYALRDVEWTQYGGRFTINNDDATGDAPAAITDNFGLALSMVQTENSLRMAVGAPQKHSSRGQETTGMVVVYDYDPTLDQWITLGDPIVESPGDSLGTAIALVNDGKLLIVGSTGYQNDRGAVRFYRFNGNGFTSEDDALLVGDKPRGLFGSVVAGTTVAGQLYPRLSFVASADQQSEIILFEEMA